VISVSPLESSNPTGTSHTVTANVHAVGGTPVVVGQLVAFSVTGVNAGATGTCVPADCKSDANGNVRFTYLGAKGVGDDTVKASFTDTAGSLQTATAQKHWTEGEPEDFPEMTFSDWPRTSRWTSTSRPRRWRSDGLRRAQEAGVRILDVPIRTLGVTRRPPARTASGRRPSLPTTSS
jgi:hypothetical protein